MVGLLFELGLGVTSLEKYRLDDDTSKLYRCFLYHMFTFMNWDKSVSILSDYRLDDRGSIPGTGKEFFL
jgi:hypothetical protein